MACKANPKSLTKNGVKVAKLGSVLLQVTSTDQMGKRTDADYHDWLSSSLEPEKNLY